MTKGTTSQGPRHLKAHTFCRRCGRRAFHRQKKECGACGFPRTTMRRYDGVYGKVRARKGQGTGRMKYLKDIPRKFRNHFRCENVYKKALPEKAKEGVDKKIEALKAYSGVMRPYPHPRSAEYISGLAAVRGSQWGVNYAEAFEVVLRAY